MAHQRVTSNTISRRSVRHSQVVTVSLALRLAMRTRPLQMVQAISEEEVRVEENSQPHLSTARV